MIRSRLAAAMPRRLPVLAAAALIAVLAGCEAGTNAPVDEWHPPTEGQETMVRDISISNVFVLGPVIGQTLPAGSSASVFLALYNGGPYDRLLSISAPGTAVSVRLLGGSVALPSQHSVLLTGPAPEVILSGLTRELGGRDKNGFTVKLVLTFQNARSASMIVPVLPRASEYSTFSPPPSPTPSPAKTPKSKASPGATPTPTASPSPSATP